MRRFQRLRSSGWDALAGEVGKALEGLELALMDAERHAVVGGDEGQDFGPKVVVGFGQYITQADGPNKGGQEGVYGTAAGLEILSSSIRRDLWDTPGRG